MRLQSLRPTEGADLLQLRHLLEGRGWRAALPQSLSDDLLLRLGRDFRSVESSIGGSAREQGPLSLAPPMYVVMKLLLGHPAQGGPVQSLSLSELGLMRALQTYQWGLEHEIVTRIVGLTSPSQTSSLLEGLWRSIQE
jgi:hypothetical protein